MQFLTKLTTGIKQIRTAITTSLGASDSGKLVATNNQGDLDISLMPPINLDYLTDVEINATPTENTPILRWDGTNFVPSRERMFFKWECYDTSIGAGNQTAFRHQAVPTTNARFSPIVDCQIFAGLSSCRDNDGADIRIFKNGAVVATLVHGGNTNVVSYTLNITAEVGDEFYVIFRRITSSTVNDLVFEMFLREII